MVEEQQDQWRILRWLGVSSGVAGAVEEEERLGELEASHSRTAVENAWEGEGVALVGELERSR